MSRWQELGLTPDEAQDEINDLTQENHALRRERDEAVLIANGLRTEMALLQMPASSREVEAYKARAEKAEAEVARLRALLSEVAVRPCEDRPREYQPCGSCLSCRARALLRRVLFEAHRTPKLREELEKEVGND